MDTLRLNAIISELTRAGDTFDRVIALELRDSLPIEPERFISLSGNVTTQSRGGLGVTNAGPASFDEEKQRDIRINTSRGTYVGRWRVVRHPTMVVIESRNADTEDAPGSSYRLLFRRNGVSLQRSRLAIWRIPIPLIGEISLGRMSWSFFKREQLA